MKFTLNPKTALDESRKALKESMTEHDPAAVIEAQGNIGFVTVYENMVRIKPGTLHFKWDGPAKLIMTPDLKGAMNFRYKDIAAVKMTLESHWRSFELVVFGNAKPILVPFNADQTDAFEAVAAAIRRKLYALKTGKKGFDPMTGRPL